MCSVGSWCCDGVFDDGGAEAVLDGVVFEGEDRMASAEDAI